MRTFINTAGTLNYMTGSLMLPSIELGGRSPNSVGVTVFMLQPGEEKIVASRVREELSAVTG